MAIVQDLLRTKGQNVWSITPDTTVLSALKMMADKDVGALLVLKKGKIAGIISERDFVREIAKTGTCLIDAPVENYMTKEVFTALADYSLDECMKIMTQKRIRHLPVVKDETVVGLISIGDVVRAMIASKESTINSLENFIEGRGYGQ